MTYYQFLQKMFVFFQMAPDYDHLTLMQKVEVFEHALEHTQGDDLAKILWVKSPSSEVCNVLVCNSTHFSKNNRHLREGSHSMNILP